MRLLSVRHDPEPYSPRCGPYRRRQYPAFILVSQSSLRCPWGLSHPPGYDLSAIDEPRSRPPICLLSDGPAPANPTASSPNRSSVDHTFSNTVTTAQQCRTDACSAFMRCTVKEATDRRVSARRPSDRSAVEHPRSAAGTWTFPSGSRRGWMLPPCGIAAIPDSTRGEPRNRAQGQQRCSPWRCSPDGIRPGGVAATSTLAAAIQHPYDFLRGRTVVIEMARYIYTLRRQHPGSARQGPSPAPPGTRSNSCRISPVEQPRRTPY